LVVIIPWCLEFDFNPGSALSKSDPTTVAHIFVIANLSAVAGAVGVMAMTWIRNKKLM
jgi:ammonia channel protein AmtB